MTPRSRQGFGCESTQISPNKCQRFRKKYATPACFGPIPGNPDFVENLSAAILRANIRFVENSVLRAATVAAVARRRR